MHYTFSRAPSLFLGRPGVSGSRSRSLEAEVVLVAKGSDRFANVRLVGHLEQGVAGMRGQATEQVGAEHRRDHGAVAAARFAGDAPVLRRG